MPPPHCNFDWAVGAMQVIPVPSPLSSKLVPELESWCWARWYSVIEEVVRELFTETEHTKKVQFDVMMAQSARLLVFVSVLSSSTTPSTL